MEPYNPPQDPLHILYQDEHIMVVNKPSGLLSVPGRAPENKDSLMTRIQGVIQARESKYIMLHAPSEKLDEIVALLPGAERPTILPLAGAQNRVAMHMVSSETLFWETMEKLKALGASSILVLPIEKMME